jgi:hypothetical protein
VRRARFINSTHDLRVSFCILFSTIYGTLQGLTHQGGPQSLRNSLALFRPDFWYSFLRGLRGWPSSAYYWYQLLNIFCQAKSHCFASHRTTHGPQQQLSCDPLPLNILITEVYSIYIKRLLFERRSRSGQQVRTSIRLVLGVSFGPTDPPDETASKGRPSCLPNSAALIMAPPIKQENLPPLEDCRLLLKNAVDINLKGHFIVSRRDGAR